MAHLEPCGQKYCTQHCHEVERRSAEHHENYTPIVFRFPQASEGMERRPLEHRETHMPLVHQLPQAPERVYEPMSQFRQRKSVEALENQGYLVARKLNNCFGRSDALCFVIKTKTGGAMMDEETLNYPEDEANAIILWDDAAGHNQAELQSELAVWIKAQQDGRSIYLFKSFTFKPYNNSATECIGLITQRYTPLEEQLRLKYSPWYIRLAVEEMISAVKNGIDIPDMDLKRFVVPMSPRSKIQVKIADFQGAKLVPFDESSRGRHEFYERVMAGVENIVDKPGIVPRAKKSDLLRQMTSLASIIFE